MHLERAYCVWSILWLYIAVIRFIFAVVLCDNDPFKKIFLSSLIFLSTLIFLSFTFQP